MAGPGRPGSLLELRAGLIRDLERLLPKQLDMGSDVASRAAGRGDPKAFGSGKAAEGGLPRPEKPSVGRSGPVG